VPATQDIITISPGKRLIGVRLVMELLNCSIGTIDRLCQRGDFPQPVRLCGRACRGSPRRWREADIEAWLDRRAAGEVAGAN
jgi:predicted DNA-binding transcriptional regulator AlpA